MLYEYGLIGLFAAVTAMYMLCLRTIRFFRSETFTITSGVPEVTFGISLLGMLLLSLVSGVIVMPLSQMLLTFLGGIYLAITRGSMNKGVVIPVGLEVSKGFLTTVLGLLLTLFLFLSCISFFMTLGSLGSLANWVPRFWLAGRLG